MKKTLLILLIFPFVAQAQVFQSYNQFENISYSEAIDLVQRLTGQKTLVIDTSSFMKKSRFIQHRLIVKAKLERDSASFVFDRYKVDANEALELEGRMVFALNDATGRFLDMFPIWKTHFDPNADANKIAANYSADSKPGVVLLGEDKRRVLFRAYGAEGIIKF